MKKTCGIFLINKNNNLLIVHPTNHPDKGFWSIPKGEPDDTDVDFLHTAVRELMEETSISVDIVENTPHYLGSNIYKSNKKTLYSFLCIDKKLDDVNVVCNSFVNLLLYSFPENDDYKWINIKDTKTLKSYLHESQIVFIDKINKMIDNL